MKKCFQMVSTQVGSLSPQQDKMATSSVLPCPCPEVEALKANEELVVESLESADLLKLCGEAVQIRVVPKHVMKSLESMDWDSVPRPRVIRYLLMHVYKNIQGNVRLYVRWLEELRKFIPGVVHQHLGGQLPRASATNKQTYLQERHIPLLTELLVECAHKWENISIALGLPERVRKDLRARQDPDCTICFNHVLTRWVMDEYDHAEPPTLENLRAALNKKHVGLGKEAAKLHAMNLEHHDSPFSMLSLEASLLEIVRQSCDTVVSDGKTTLLEVQAVTSQGSSIQYQWFKDDQPFSECHDSILCIDNASLYFKGEYKCVTSTQDGSVSISSKPISLNISFAPIKRILVHKYLSEPEVPEDSWPPEGNNTYINLALIKPGNIDTAGEYGRNTMQGNMDDILADKDSIEYDQAFTNLKSTTRLLIEGRPGSGKTTLVHKFSQDWARGNPQLNLKNMNLLFLVHLRGFFNEHTIKLCDIVQLFYAQKSMVDAIVQQAEASNGEGFCFILDGLDEYRPKSMKSTFIFRLIKKETLPMAVVIIASRPAASSQFRRTASKQIEVIGFLKKQITEYVDKYPFCNAEKHELHKYLEHHPNVHHMCYLPIHAAMVCYLFNILGSILPRTVTEMYKQFTNLTLLHTFKRNHGKVQFKSIEDLPVLGKNLLINICELSFQKTVSSKLVMKRSEVLDFFDQVSSGRESLGLITVDLIAQQYGFEDLYTFLHLTFQEYLAAYHLFQMDKECQLKELREHGKKKHMQVVWKFFCGLAQFAANDTRLVELVKTAGLKEDSLFGVQCAFESQQSVVCDYVVESGEHGTLSFKGHFLTPSDLTAIGYVMKTSTYPVEKLVLDRCKLSREGVEAFLGEAGEKILSVKTLCFRYKACVCEQYQLLSVCLSKMSTIETLDLIGCDLGSKKIASLTNNGTCSLPNLQILQVSASTLNHTNAYCFRGLKFHSSRITKIVFDQKLDDHCRKYLLEAFSVSPLFFNSISSCERLDLESIWLDLQNIALVASHLKQQHAHSSLNLFNCNIGDDSCEALADGLAHCSNLKELFLSNNKIGDYGAVRLSKALKCCGQLESVSLRSNQIGDTGIAAVADGIGQCTLLQNLDISHNYMGKAGSSSLATSLKNLTNIAILNLKCTNSGVFIFAESFKFLVKMEVLNISYNGIGNTGAVAVGNYILHCTALQKLDMCYNHIGDEGAISLSSGLHHLKNMIELNLSYNSIGDEGSEAIARAVAHMEGLKLRIWNHGISERGRSYIASHVKDIDTDFHSLDINHKTAMELDILSQNMQVPSSNYVTEERSSSIPELSRCLRALIFKCDIWFVSSECKKAFAKVWQQVSGLQTVELHGPVFGEHSADALTEGLQHNHNLQTLILHNVGTDAGGLAVALEQCKCLHTLELTSCEMYGDSSKVFALSLMNCHNLQTLKLKFCGIGDGTKALLKHLHKCSNLQNLDLCGNEIGDDSAEALSEHLHKCSNLQDLDLSYNHVGNRGAKCLAKHLQLYGSLQYLKIDNNDIGDDGAMALVMCMQKYQIPQNHINLSGNYKIRNTSLRTIIDSKSASVFVEA